MAVYCSSKMSKMFTCHEQDKRCAVTRSAATGQPKQKSALHTGHRLTVDNWQWPLANRKERSVSEFLNALWPATVCCCFVNCDPALLWDRARTTLIIRAQWWPFKIAITKLTMAMLYARINDNKQRNCWVNFLFISWIGVGNFNEASK